MRCDFLVMDEHLERLGQTIMSSLGAAVTGCAVTRGQETVGAYVDDAVDSQRGEDGSQVSGQEHTEIVILF